MEGGGHTSISLLRTICSSHVRHLGSCWKGFDTVCMYVVLRVVCNLFPCWCVQYTDLGLHRQLWGGFESQQGGAN